MIYFFISLIILLLAYCVFLLFRSPSDFASAKFLSFIEQRKLTKTNHIGVLESFIAESNPDLSNIIGDKIVLRLIIPIILVLLISTLLIAPILTNFYFAIPLGLLITLAYGSRIFYSLSSSFRSKVLFQLERILRSIRNNLSTGMTLDYAVNSAVKFNSEKPLGTQLQKFIRISDTNFLENFPKWLLSVKRNFNIKELGKSAQLLALELQFSLNQEEAFLNAVAQVSERISLNRKQKNLIFMTLLTMDFMVLALFAVLFLVIPNIGLSSQLSWWESSRRPLIVFISSAVIWTAYFITVFIMLRRQS